MTPTPALPPTRVILYHSVGPVRESEPGWRDRVRGMVISPEVLEGHIALLRERGYRFATAGELAEQWRADSPPPGIAVLTFDDGWRSGLTTVAPLLARLGLRATFFVCPGGFGNHLRPLSDAGMELASHTLSHRNLLTLSDAELRLEFEGSRAAVEALTGEPCLTLAYPTGRHDDRIEQAAAAAGYQLAFTGEHGPWRRFAAPRIQPTVVPPPTRLFRTLQL